MVALRKSHVLDFFLSQWVLQQRDFSNMVALGFRYMVVSTGYPSILQLGFSKSRLKWNFGQSCSPTIILVTGWMFFLRKSVNFFGFWVDVIFMEFPYCGISLDDFYCGFILGSGFSIGLPLTDIMRNVYMHVYWCIAYMREMIFIAVCTMFN